MPGIDPTARLRWRLAFAVRVLRADLGNFFLLQYRASDAFLITAKNSGTHWLKFLLSHAIAHRHGVPGPDAASGRGADAIIGHPRWPVVHSQLRRIASSHTIPSIAFSWRLKPLRPAPTVVLVRDIREALLSNYVKWQRNYATSFTEYLRGAPSGGRFVADIWWYIHFFNRWGDIARTWPDAILVVRYEDVQAAPEFWLRRIARHLGEPLDDEAVAAAMPYIGRDAVRAQLDPEYGEVIIPAAADRAAVTFRPADTALFDAILYRHLRHAHGYDYRLNDHPAPAADPQAQPGLAR